MFNNRFLKIILKGQDGRQQAGVTMVQAAIIIPLILVLTMGTIDVIRLGFIKLILEYSANRAVNYATTLPINTDITAAACLTNQAQCDAYMASLNAIQQKAVEVADLVTSASGASGYALRLPVHMYDKAHYSGPAWVTSGLPVEQVASEVAFIRPGEGFIEEPGYSDKWVSHKLRSFGTNVEQGWPQVGENWDSVLEKHPVQVRIAARVKNLILPDVVVVGDQYGYLFSGSAQSAPPPPAVATCPNLICEASESCLICPADCGACVTCPNGVCDPTESCTTCPQDCGACGTCGNGVCDRGEDAASCCSDCPGTCGDGICCGAENCGTCRLDCLCPPGKSCAGNACADNGVCVPSCPAYGCGVSDGCGGTCSCAAGLDCVQGSCVTPIQPFCGDGTKQPGEECDGDASVCGINYDCINCSCVGTITCGGSPQCSSDADCAATACPDGEVGYCALLGNASCCRCRKAPEPIPEIPVNNERPVLSTGDSGSEEVPTSGNTEVGSAKGGDTVGTEPGSPISPTNTGATTEFTQPTIHE